MADAEAVVRAVEAWGAPAWPDIWRPFRERGIGDTSAFVEQAEAVLRAEPSLVPAWQHFVEDKRFTPSWAPGRSPRVLSATLGDIGARPGAYVQ